MCIACWKCKSRQAVNLPTSVNLGDTFMSHISVLTLDVDHAFPPPQAMPPSHLLYASGAGGAGGAEIPWRRLRGGEGRASVCEESHDSERGRVICSCPFITFIKVWGEDTCSLSDLFCQSQQWWDSQLGSLLQADPSVNIEEVERDRTACLILEDVHRTHLVFNVSVESATYVTSLTSWIKKSCISL